MILQKNLKTNLDWKLITDVKIRKKHVFADEIQAFR